MSARPSNQPPDSPRKFLPSVNPLESRLLLSRQLSFPDGSSYVFPTFPHLPRTGGVSVQSGTALTVGVGQRTTNTVVFQEDTAGNVSAEWNARPTHSFTNTQATLVQIGKARRDQVTFQLPNIRTGGTAIATGQLLAANGVSSKTLAHPMHAHQLSVKRTGGTAVQSGSVLTISVTSSKINTVAVSSSDFGTPRVSAEWNGGAPLNFTGISTIIVDIKNGTRDLVALDQSSAQ